MDLKKILPWSFVLFIVVTIIGSVFRIMHWPFSIMILEIGFLLLVFFIIVAVNEILKSKKINGTEKFIWVIGLLFFGMFTGLLYLVGSRKKII